MIRTHEGTTRLQGIGIVEGIKAKNIQVGDVLVWNFGSTSKVVAIEFSKTGKTLIVTTEHNGELYERRMTAERIVVVKELNPAPAVEEVEEEVEEVVETEEMKANFEEAEKFLGYVRKYKDMNFYGEAQLFYRRYRKAGGTQIIEHLEHPERYKELLEEEPVKKEEPVERIRFVKETNPELKGGILCFKNGIFKAFTSGESRKYQTYMGARVFLARNGYVMEQEKF